MTAESPAAGTTEWQADSVHAHLDEQAGYLATVSASTLMQHVRREHARPFESQARRERSRVGCGNVLFGNGTFDAPTGERLRAVNPFEQVSAAGTYCSTTVMHVVAGSVPR